MAKNEHLAILKKGIETWNQWRKDNQKIVPDLTESNLSYFDFSGADLNRADLNRAILTGSNLNGANLSEAKLIFAQLDKANLSGAKLSAALMICSDLTGAELIRADLEGAILYRAILEQASLNEANLSRAFLFRADLTNSILTAANLGMANLIGAKLTGANLSGADLSGANLADANLSGSDLTGCRVHAISAWDFTVDEETKQRGLIITPQIMRRDSTYDPWEIVSPSKPEVTVDDLKLAQFVYLLIDNENVRDIIHTITTKAVLILGRFSDERKQVLDALREKLREYDLTPIVFDFTPSENRDLTETVQMLASMSKFVIADISDPKSIPQELSHILPFLPSVPVVPILFSELGEYSMFEHWEKYPSLLPTYCYKQKNDLVENIESAILEPIERWRLSRNKKEELELRALKAESEVNRMKKILKEHGIDDPSERP